MWYPTIDVRGRLLRAVNTVLSPLSLVIHTSEESLRDLGAAYDAEHSERLRLARHLHTIDVYVDHMHTTPIVLAVRYQLDLAFGRRAPGRVTLWESLTRMGVPMGPASKKEP
jgi:hypothetical protein